MASAVPSYVDVGSEVRRLAAHLQGLNVLHDVGDGPRPGQLMFRSSRDYGVMELKIAGDGPFVAFASALRAEVTLGQDNWRRINDWNAALPFRTFCVAERVHGQAYGTVFLRTWMPLFFLRDGMPGGSGKEHVFDLMTSTVYAPSELAGGRVPCTTPWIRSRPRKNG
jgi:hypothetical protein